MAKKNKFSTYLTNMATNLKESTDFFSDYKVKTEKDLAIFANKMTEYEHKGDEIVHDIIKELNTTFITPIDREDILLLANSMDDVLDGLEQCAALFEMYAITDINQYMLQFVEEIKICSYEILESVELLTTKKYKNIREKVIKINAVESKCDVIERESIKNLFLTEKDPIRIIQYKEIYQSFEEIADACEAVANTLETILMKNA
ncbi:hypothetical protein J43TS3_03660 [Ornithinibacillus bavariensis]|uniref:DUF47 domain-containing protein n=2 Tax=Ornithinibacillus bavariensis TaxID=545502 RepID=A0A919X727_9BACI|nr:hypothetical protein J43TS3_03660 [Ornithinibacillus bavariensis]